MKTVSISGGNIVISGGKITVNGKNITLDENEKQFTIIVNGAVDNLEVDVAESIEIKGEAGSVKTTNGNVTCRDVLGSVSTVNGDVRASKINGGVSTVNGDVN